jgi:chemotaxis protein CheX
MYDVSGIIGMSGEARGNVVLSFPKDAALKVVSAFAGIQSKCLDEDFCDAVGELANMVAGNAKKDLEGLHVSISIPSVVLGRNHRIMTERKAPCICVPFTCDHGRFALEVSLVTDSKPAPVGARK